MTPPEPQIIARDVSLTYKLFDTTSRRGLLGLSRNTVTAVPALQSVSLQVDAGESVGIVGRNGAGKSTLLQVLSGRLRPTTGDVFVRQPPRVFSVSSALKGHLTGWENIDIGLIALGFDRQTRSEMRRSVAEDSGLEDDQLSRVFRSYSSGMKARLKFAIAAADDPGILLLDEALAVGDRKFKNSALRRVEELRDAAKAIVMVTHGLGEIERVCTRAIWLDQGRIVADDDPDTVIAAYKENSDR